MWKETFPANRENCKHAKKVLTNSDNDFNVMPDSGVPAEGTSTSNDFFAMPQGGVPVPKGKKSAGHHADSDMDDSNSS